MVNFVAIDFETANYRRESACAVGMVKVAAGRIVAREHRLINPKASFLPRFTRDVHGIRAADVADAPLFDEAWTALLPMLEGADFLAAHNAPFDSSVLTTCCRRYRLPPPAHRFVCTLRAARRHWRLKSASLEAVCRHLGIKLNHHQALSDAAACATILLEAIRGGYVIPR